MGRPLKIAKAQLLTVTATSNATGQVTVSDDLNTLNVIKGQAFILSTTVGTLIAGTTYWILSIVDSTHFTVSDVHPSANPSSAPFALGTVGPVSSIAAVNIVDQYFNNPAGVTNTYSAVGGNVMIYGPQVQVNVAISINGTGTLSASTGSAALTGVGTDFTSYIDGTKIGLSNGTYLGILTDSANATALTGNLSANAAANASGSTFVYAVQETGYIVRQKGKQKYLVHGLTSGLDGACYTANSAGLAPGQMSILAVYDDLSTAFVQSLSIHNGEVFGPNLELQNAQPVFATFNTAYAANTFGGQPYPIVIINNG